MAAIQMAVINGTGPPGDEYHQLMQASFCRQLGDGLGEARCFYQRGPEIFGLEVLDEALAAHAWLKAAHLRDPDARLMMAGFSRGGSAAIKAAEFLARDGIAVDSLFLFDAVARHEFHGGRVIPANVRFSRHARRCHDPEFLAKYEGMVGAFFGLEANPIRPLFGNTGLSWEGDGDHQPAEVFVGSHGAVGGVGWRFIAEDVACESAVAAWMNDHLAARGVDLELKAVAPPDRPAAHPPALQRWVMRHVYDLVIHST